VNKFFLRLIFPRFLALSVMGWDDLLMMAASAAMTAGAQSATRPNVSSTEFGNTPNMETNQQDPFEWVNQILAQRASRQQ
jgi:hypothetical protein